MFLPLKRASARLLAVAALVGLGSFPAAVFAQTTPAKTSCDCYCASEQGAVKIDTVPDAATCDSKCTAKYPKMVVCAKNAAQAPGNLPKCFSDENTCKQTCSGSSADTTGSGYIFDTSYQPPECPGKFHYCYCTGQNYKLEIPINGTKEVSDVGSYVQTWYKYLLGFSVIVAIIMVMVGGLQYLLAAGGGDTKTAKGRIKGAIVGLVLLFGASLILQTVNPRLLTLQPPRLPSVKRIEYITPGMDCHSLKDKGYVLLDKPSGSPSGKYGCGSRDTVVKDKFGTAVPDGTTCVYRNCNDKSEGCFVTADSGTCLKCENVSSDTSVGFIMPSIETCGQISPIADDAAAKLGYARCFWTQAPNLLWGANWSSVANAAGLTLKTAAGAAVGSLLPVPGGAVLGAAVGAGTSDAVKLYMSGLCASVKIDACSGIQTCTGYNTVQVVTAKTTGVDLQNVEPGWGDLSMKEVCQNNPCKIRPGYGCTYRASDNTCGDLGLCAADSDCGTGQACNSGICSSTHGCSADTDCDQANGYKCVSDHCIKPAAPQPAGGTCLTDDGCQAGHCIKLGAGGVCSSGAAGNVCAQNSDCQSGMACQSNSCTPASGKATGATCSTGSECQSGLCANGGYCSEGKTGSPCRLDNDCTTGFYCPDGVAGMTNCVTKLATGKACDSDKQCINGDCVGNMYGISSGKCN